MITEYFCEVPAGLAPEYRDIPCIFFFGTLFRVDSRGRQKPLHYLRYRMNRILGSDLRWFLGFVLPVVESLYSQLEGVEEVTYTMPKV